MAKEGKKKLIVGNWKMNLTVPEATILAERLKKEIVFVDGVETVVAPSFVSLYSVSETLADSAISVGAQDVFYEENGSYTGEVSAAMLRGLAKYCIVGHSERRIYFGESDRDVSQKVKALLTYDIKPIICIGETLREHSDGLSKVVAVSEAEAALRFVTKEDLENITFAYEPVWAIGSGKACHPDDAENVIQAVQKFIKALFGDKAADKIRILYGGSVNAENAKGFMKKNIDGFLVGGASLDHEEFTEIVKTTLKSS
ncbi:MAG: triose-phosphate isomerase [Patescibacteria group bacterium]|nr:triose-phosphate isomerase [Patescibacteria group bacterium]